MSRYRKFGRTSLADGEGERAKVLWPARLLLAAWCRSGRMCRRNDLDADGGHYQADLLYELVRWQRAGWVLTLPHAEISDEAPLPEYRNLFGWILFALLAAFLVLGQLVLYLDRTPNATVIRARIEKELQNQVALVTTLGEASREANQKQLEQEAKDLKPLIPGDAEATLLYAAVRTEQGLKLTAPELTPLRLSKDALYRNAYRVYSQDSLDPQEARRIAASVPSGRFLHRLMGAQAMEKGKLPNPRKGLTPSGIAPQAVTLLVTGSLLVLGLALLFIYVVLRGMGLAIPKGFAVRDLSLPDADRLVFRSAQIFTAYLSFQIFGPIILRSGLDKTVASTLILVAILATIVLLARVPVQGKWISFKTLGITFEHLGRHVAWGIAAAVANFPILLAVTMISAGLFSGLPAPEHPATVELTEASSIWVILQLVFAASVAAPFIEEILFRGTLFPAISKVARSPVAGALISSAIFAAIHPTGIPVWPALASIGAMSCFLAYQTGSLVPSITMHAVHNLVMVVYTIAAFR